MTARIVLTSALAAWLGAACAEDEPSLLVELVPNPEINTRANVAEHVNSLKVVFEAQGGFAGLDADEGDDWGPYEVTDFDGDGVLDLVLTRPPQTLDPFAVTQGSQGNKVLEVSARGFGLGEAEVTAIGPPTASAFVGRQARVEVPFNLVPAYLPLRVTSMVPSQGSQVTPTIDSVTVQLSGEVLPTALEGQVELLADSVGESIVPDLSVSFVDTGMGRLTNVRLQGCTLTSGRYVVTLGTGIESTRGQYLDQQLGLEGRQPFLGEFTISGDPEPPSCDMVGVLSSFCSDAVPCEPGYDCQDGVCVLSVEALPEGGGLCEPASCGPSEEFVCHPVEGCVPSCLPYGACLDPTATCDPETGLCS